MPKHFPLAALLACVALTACDIPGEQPVTGPDPSHVYNVAPIDEGGGGCCEGGGGGDDGSGGGSTVPPFNPPAPPFIFANDLTHVLLTSSLLQSCGQIPHPFWGFSYDVTQGTVIYLSGVVAPGTQMHWGIYNQAGQRVADHMTRPSGDNCVVAHEPEGFSTAGLAPGYYYLYASYVRLVTLTIHDWYSGYQNSVVGKYVGPLRVR